MNEPYFLTIAIPTYNRNEKLARSLHRLLPQLIAGVCIKIFDNGSPVPVLDTLHDLIVNFPQVSIIRSNTNIGGDGNFIKVFSTIETKWMWFLGDDEVVETDAVHTILNTINENAEVGYINFSSYNVKTRHVPTYCSTKEALINSLDSFGNLLFISVGVYNMRFFKDPIHFMYHYSYAYASQVAMIVQSFDYDPAYTIMLSEKTIIDEKFQNTTDWSWIAISWHISSIFELSDGLAPKVQKKWMWHIRTHVRTPITVYNLLKADNFKNHNYQYALYVFDQIFFKVMFSGIEFRRIVTYVCFRALIMLQRLKYSITKK